MRTDVAPEVQQHGGLGADLGDGGEGGAGVAARGQQRPDDAQVRARRDRQELGQPLQQAQEGASAHAAPLTRA
jgi:hypothetical protein